MWGHVLSDSMLLGNLTYTSKRYDAKFLHGLILDMYQRGYDILSISEEIGVKPSYVRRVVAKNYLMNKLELKYRPVRRKVEEAVIDLYKKGVSRKEIKRMVLDKECPNLSRLLGSSLVDAILLKHGVIEPDEKTRELIKKHVEISSTGTVADLQELGIGSREYMFLSIVTEKRPRSVKERDRKITANPILTIHKAIVNLYNQGYSCKTIAGFLSLDSGSVSTIINMYKSGKEDVFLRNMEKYIAYRSVVYNPVKPPRYKLITCGFTNKSPLKSILGRNNLLRRRNLFFLSKEDLLKFILRLLYIANQESSFLSNMYMKKSVTYWLKSNGFKQTDVEKIYSMVKQARSLEELEEKVGELAKAINI